MVIPWIGFPLAKLLEKVEPNSQAKYVAFQTLLDPRRMPNQRTGVLDWPYVEGLAPRRGDAPARNSGNGFVWADATRTGRCTDTSGGAVEVWIQEHQVDREDKSGGPATSDDLERRVTGRIRLLFKRQSERRSSALESGERTANRRVQRPRDLDVQWLRRTSCALVRWNGFENGILIASCR